MENENKSKKVVPYMSIEEAVDHICVLLNLMSLADVVPEGTTVYNTDTGELDELVPMIREAKAELQWLMDRAGIIGDGAKCGCQCSSANGSSEGDDGTFAVGFVSHANDVNAASSNLDKAMDKFRDWFMREVDNATVEDIERVLKCGGPAIGPAERKLLEGVLARKQVEKIFGKSGLESVIVRIRRD